MKLQYRADCNNLRCCKMRGGIRLWRDGVVGIFGANSEASKRPTSLRYEIHRMNSIRIHVGLSLQTKLDIDTYLNCITTPE